MQTGLCLFKDSATASRAVLAVLANGVLPRALEFIDDVAIAASAAAKAPFQFPSGCGAAVLVEVDGNSPESRSQEIRSALGRSASGRCY